MRSKSLRWAVLVLFTLFALFIVAIAKAPADTKARAAWAWAQADGQVEAAKCNCGQGGRCSCGKKCKCHLNGPKLEAAGWQWSDEDGGHWWRYKPQAPDPEPTIVETALPKATHNMHSFMQSAPPPPPPPRMQAPPPRASFGSSRGGC